jgi:CheY-like chemotaxis protein
MLSQRASSRIGTAVGWFGIEFADDRCDDLAEGPAMTLLNLHSPHSIEDDLEYELDPFAESLELGVEDSRIMVVDDDDRVALMMTRLLERDGFRHVLTVGDGQQAVDTVLDHPPDVVVLDVHLPRLDGFQVLREIVRHDGEVGRVTGVIAVSGDVDPATCETMMSGGADDFISRPFENGEFALRVRRIAHRTRALRRALGYARLLEGHLRDVSRS